MTKETKRMIYEMASIWFYMLMLLTILTISVILAPFIFLHRIYKHIYEGVIYERETENGDSQRSKARGARRWVYRRIMGRKMS